MTEINHRRGDHKRAMKSPVCDIDSPYLRSIDKNELPRRGGYFPRSDKPWKEIDMSFFSTGRVDPHIGEVFSKPFIGNDFCNGKKGMRKAVAGAKKFVNSRTRFKIKAKLKKIDIENMKDY